MFLLGKRFESMHILDTKSGARFWRTWNGKVAALDALEIVHDSPKIPGPCGAGSSRALARAGCGVRLIPLTMRNLDAFDKLSSSFV